VAEEFADDGSAVLRLVDAGLAEEIEGCEGVAVSWEFGGAGRAAGAVVEGEEDGVADGEVGFGEGGAEGFDVAGAWEELSVGLVLKVMSTIVCHLRVWRSAVAINTF
jgi:hypothetical protein